MCALYRFGGPSGRVRFEPVDEALAARAQLASEELAQAMTELPEPTDPDQLF